MTRHEIQKAAVLLGLHTLKQTVADIPTDELADTAHDLELLFDEVKDCHFPRRFTLRAGANNLRQIVRERRLVLS